MKPSEARALPYPSTKPYPEKRCIVLQEDWTFEIDSARFVALPGFEFDGASIPRLAWTALGVGPKDERVLTAALEHDYMCRYRPRDVSSVAAADAFGARLRLDGLHPWRAAVMVRAVKWFGPRW